MQRYHDLTSAALNIRNPAAVEAGLKYGLDMMRLCLGDNRGLRWQVPPLYLLLWRDQEACALIKWYATVVTGSCDWHDMELPFLNLHGEDAFEGFQEHGDKMNDLSQLVTMRNFGARLMLDVKGLKDHVARHPNLSYEERMEWVREGALSNVLCGRREAWSETTSRTWCMTYRRRSPNCISASSSSVNITGRRWAPLSATEVLCPLCIPRSLVKR
ncbi:hypothetical protein DL763_004273 [Monosporascus cannonballus]|nr:hypothetical protein DL763_004273 [Monosporascus cannonballus]